ncbi:hypothetical protein CDOMC_a003 (plasmid) [Campylobacter sp. RM16192]|nr:hypothetical protein CDOMC_a003 [Campylobacter sp. RM16192]
MNKDKLRLNPLKYKTYISNIRCPRCQKGVLVRNLSKKGIFWWGCTNLKNGCRVMYYDNNGNPKI